jgi:cellulose synthase/poly-beta-1,6-N-acetylglucosamine synthase-like glycosyltransferase
LPVTLSVIVPAYNCGAQLARCLGSIQTTVQIPFETIVVDDGSTDDTREIARSFDAKVLSTGGRKGPAFARNLGAKTAIGEVFVFLDSDVCVKPETLSKIGQCFDTDPQLDALIGSYDDAPTSKDFISQYRNLMHAYVHQTGAERASTFWSGCGAIRRHVLLEHSGFNEDYARPAIEDIELGYRLIRAGRKIVLDRSVVVTHLKRWTFWGLVKTDIMDRGIPWTELILRDRFMPNDLNLQLSQRVSVALAVILVFLSGTLAVMRGAYLLIPLFAILFLMLAGWWGEFGSYQRPRRAFAFLTCMVGLISAGAYVYGMYGLVVPLMIAPGLLVLRHRYSERRSLSKLYRVLEIVFILSSICVAALYLVAALYVHTGHLIFACVAILISVGVMNSQFYIFLAGKRGVVFMLAAMPFHLLYHLYNGVSFIAGVGHYYWSSVGHRTTVGRTGYP